MHTTASLKAQAQATALKTLWACPAPKRGSGRTRIFHLFNSLSHARREVAELTVWDWIGDLRRLAMRDADRKRHPFQLGECELQQYWDHKYIRVLVDQEVPALGYTTVVLYERGLDSYPVYLQTNEQVSRCYDDVVLENEQTIVTISAETGRIKSLVDKTTGQELIGEGKEAGLVYQETECKTSSAWNIGRAIKNVPVDRCVELSRAVIGELRSSVTAHFTVENSTAEVTYVLEKDQPLVRVELKVDWKEIGKDIIPVLTWQTPLSLSDRCLPL